MKFNMGNQLPLELLSEIAAYLKEVNEPLAPYTTVCRQWQAAFEPKIYRQICVYSVDLSRLHTVTSGNGIARRAMIRGLDYRIMLPYHLDDYYAITEDKEYRKENPIRQANDETFEQAITELFTTLASWDQTHRLSLDLLTLGDQRELEPWTEEFWEDASEDAREFRWLQHGHRLAVRPYRARLLDSSASALPAVSCIDKLSFFNSGSDPRHRIWGGTALQIAQRCPSLTWLHLDLDEYVRPDNVDYMRDRRQGSIPLIPCYYYP
jgi:hypothetical protein